MTHRDSLAPFLHAESLDKVKRSIKDGSPPVKDAVVKLSESEVGKSLFQFEHATLEKISFDEKADAAIKDAEYHSFSSDEVDNFYRKMSRSVALLVRAGHRAFVAKDDDSKIRVSWLGSSLEYPMLGLQDRWTKPMSARVKSIALSNGSTKRLPWEWLLFGASGPIDDLPVSVAIPEDMQIIVDNRNARAEVLQCFAGVWGNVVSFARMRKVVSPLRKSLLEKDPTFVFELDHLMRHAANIALERCRDQILACLPEGAASDVSMTQAKVAIQELMKQDLFLAVDVSMEQEVANLIGMVQSLIDGKGINMASNFSSFFQRAVEKMSWWCSYEQVGKKKGTTKVLYGPEAAAEIYENVLKTKTKTLSDFAILRRFKWLLSIDQQTNVDVWVKKLTRERASAYEKAALCDGMLAIDDDDAGISTGTGTSASSSSGASSSTAKICRKRSEVTASVVDEASKSSAKKKALLDGVF